MENCPGSVKNEVAQCFLMTELIRKFDVERSETNGLTMYLQGEASDRIASVVVLKSKGEPAAGRVAPGTRFR
jgi:hypothetical protein